MSFGRCSFESEVARHLGLGHWPDAVPADLRAHVNGCGACRDLIAVAQAFRRERTHAAAAARLESPGVLWWRAQIRRRNAALERIHRPLLGAQIFAVVLSITAAALFLATQPRRKIDWLSWLAELPRAMHFEALLPPALQNPLGIVALVLAIVGAVAVISGALAYATSEKR